MGFRKKPDATSIGMLCMVVCAGLYWSTILLSNFDADVSPNSVASFFSASFFISYAVFILTMALGAVFARRLSEPGAQKALAWVTVACCALILVSQLPFVALRPAASVVVLLLQGIRTATYIMFWGLNFTSLDKRDAERATIGSLGVAFVAYLVLSLLVRDATAILCAASVIMIASLVPFLAGLYRIEVRQRPDVAPNRKLLVPFFATRVLCGVCLGIAMVLCSFVEPESSERAILLTVASVVVLLATFAVMMRQGRTNLTLLRLAPLVACGATICPFLTGTDTLVSLCGHVPAIIWLCWIILHSVQISAIKEESGLGDALLSFTEKIVFMGSAVLTVAVLALVPNVEQAISANGQATYEALIVVAFLVLIVCTYQLNRVIDGKQTELIVEGAFELTEQRLEPLYASLGERYGLTAREMEVFRLIAKGYSRPAICEELFISESTARSHAHHIYQKMGIHSRDELIALLEEAAREHVASPPAPRASSESADFEAR